MAVDSEDRVARLERRLADAEGRLARLERHRSGARDEMDARLLRVLADSTQRLWFTTTEVVVRHARLDGRLRQALLDADIEDARQFGCFLSRRVAEPIDEIQIEHAPRQRRWRVRHVQHLDMLEDLAASLKA